MYVVSCMKARNFKDPYSNCELQKVEELEATRKDLEATLQESQGDNRCDHVLSSLVSIIKPVMSQLYPTPWYARGHLDNHSWSTETSRHLKVWMGTTCDIFVSKSPLWHSVCDSIFCQSAPFCTLLAPRRWQLCVRTLSQDVMMAKSEHICTLGQVV